VAGGVAIPFDTDTLSNVLAHAAALPEHQRLYWGCLAQKRVQECYSWDAVTDVYEKLFQRITDR
jgi:glycosyltransferase involved in cell wall biosynthesis